MILELSPCYPIVEYNTKTGDNSELNWRDVMFQQIAPILKACAGKENFDITNCNLLRFQVVFTIDMAVYNQESQKFQDFGELNFQNRLILL